MMHSIVRQLKLNLRYAFGLYPSSSALSSLMSNAAEAPSVFVGVNMCAEGGSVCVCVEGECGRCCGQYVAKVEYVCVCVCVCV